MQLVNSSLFALVVSFASVSLAAHARGHQGDTLVVSPATTGQRTTENVARAEGEITGAHLNTAPVMISGELRGRFPGAFVSGLVESNQLPGRLDASRRIISPDRIYRAEGGPVIAPEMVSDLRLLSPGSTHTGRNVETTEAYTNPEITGTFATAPRSEEEERLMTLRRPMLTREMAERIERMRGHVYGGRRIRIGRGRVYGRGGLRRFGEERRGRLEEGQLMVLSGHE